MSINNIVSKELLRSIQKDAINEIADSVTTSFGPKGGNSQICKDAAKDNRNADPLAINLFSKDGHTILSTIQFDDIISGSVVSALLSVTSSQVKTIGDGTTSAVESSRRAFNALTEYEKEHPEISPRDLCNKLHDAIIKVQNEIAKRGQEFDAQAAYDIAYISTNRDDTIADTIKQIYEEIGNDVFIDIETSMSRQTILRKLDGMSLTTGFGDMSEFINDLRSGSCLIEEINGKVPHVYYFQNNVDTAEQVGYLMSIIGHNIVEPYQKKRPGDAIPTVILCKFVSEDVKNSLVDVLSFMNAYNREEYIKSKPPLLMITHIHQEDVLADIADMCGCRAIQKYSNDEIYRQQLKEGKAPTVQNVYEFYGTCKQVKADAVSTTFIDPKRMKEDDIVTTVDDKEVKVVSAYFVNKDLQEGTNIITDDIEKELVPLVNTTGDIRAKIVVPRNKQLVLFCQDDITCTFAENAIVSFKAVSCDDYSAHYKSMLESKKAILSAAEARGADAKELGAIKRRIRSLDSKTIQYCIGGLSPQDRDANKYLLEDAVLNCRSAAKEGYGLGANAEGVIATYKLLKENPDDEMLQVLFDIYKSVLTKLYDGVVDATEIDELIENIVKEDAVLNIVTGKFDKRVITSIVTDSNILECLDKIISLLITCTQCILPSPGYNKYGSYIVK